MFIIKKTYSINNIILSQGFKWQKNDEGGGETIIFFKHSIIYIYILIILTASNFS